MVPEAPARWPRISRTFDGGEPPRTVVVKYALIGCLSGTRARRGAALTAPSRGLLPRLSDSGIMCSRSGGSSEGRFVGWHGPYPIAELLDRCLQQGFDLPPDSHGVYVVSKRCWEGTPTLACDPLYVGSTTGNSARFRTRVGDLIADMFGFFTTETAHHSGGQSLYRFCQENGIHPNHLFIGWLSDCACLRCEEVRLYKELRPKLNRKCPTRCSLH